MTVTNENAREWVEIDQNELPAGLRWDIPRKNQGQIVEVSYADRHTGAGGAAEWHADFKRVADRSDGSIDYYRATEAEYYYVISPSNGVELEECPRRDGGRFWRPRRWESAPKAHAYVDQFEVPGMILNMKRVIALPRSFRVRRSHTFGQLASASRQVWNG